MRLQTAATVPDSRRAVTAMPTPASPVLVAVVVELDVVAFLVVAVTPP